MRFVNKHIRVSSSRCKPGETVDALYLRERKIVKEFLRVQPPAVLAMRGQQASIMNHSLEVKKKKR